MSVECVCVRVSVCVCESVRACACVWGGGRARVFFSLNWLIFCVDLVLGFEYWCRFCVTFGLYKDVEGSLGMAVGRVGLLSLLYCTLLPSVNECCCADGSYFVILQ